MSDTSGRSSPGPFTLVLRAAFVPDGEDPPPEFAADFSPLKFRATLDRATGIITCDSAGMNFGGDIRAEWHPDEVQGPETGEHPTGYGSDEQESGRRYEDTSGRAGSAEGLYQACRDLG